MKQHSMPRIAASTLITALLLLGSAHGQQPQRRQAAVPSNKATKAVDPMQAAIEKKLDTIACPATDFQGTALVEAVDSLRTWAKELDAGTTDPAKKGINFMIRAPRDFQPGSVRMKLEKMSLRKALENITEATGTRFYVDESGVTVVPKDSPYERDPKPGDAAAIKQAAKNITIPEINFEDAPLKEVVEFLNQQIKEQSKGEAPFVVSIDPAKVDNSTRVRELRLRNVPATDALKYLAEASNTMLTAGDKEIWVTRR